MKLFLKMGHRVPELLARAAVGDVWAIVILTAMGISAIGVAVKNSKHFQK